MASGGSPNKAEESFETNIKSDWDSDSSQEGFQDALETETKKVSLKGAAPFTKHEVIIVSVCKGALQCPKCQQPLKGFVIFNSVHLYIEYNSKRKGK